ncbi:heme o synthase [Oceanimonas baumannii]|uniref:Protoheme IX farnesyltransferase n=1 Tax=Oceanimonas baumannii TaxID=129578 RepID=A0A235CI73_9GAMM|nr:heme o synthase [Oceanimonas baumannii]MCC4264283.1 heme o synthase [Oceanimonas baumannii]OYD23545.1 protoheme IX farnesyltransferase [Oceanimonas baumannii]
MARSLALSATGIRVWRDYFALTKPKVVALILLTAVVGMFLTEVLPSVLTVMAATLGIGLMAGGAAAINHVLDRRIDIKMARTHHRPVAQGRVATTNALAFALVLSASGLVILLVLVNALTAWLTLASLLGYAVVYTVWLKRATPQNIVIGGLAGAMPPLLGWTAVSGEFHGHALLLVMIIFTWTPPHFWALAIHRRDDYAKADIPMLPVTHGIEFTKTCVLLYTLLLTLVCLLPWITGMSGPAYLLGSLALNLRFIQWAWRLKFRPGPQTALQCFRFSISHLMWLFVLILADHWIDYG